MPLLILGHGILGAIGLITATQDEDGKRPAFFLGIVGAVLGLLLFFFRHADASWRTTSIETGPAVAAGLAAAAAWLIVGVSRRDRGSVWNVPLVGVAGCALLLFALNRWTVTALLFWLVTSVALAAMVRDERNRVQIWTVLSLSDLLVAVALVAHAVQTESWVLPGRAQGSTWWLIACAAIIRSGALPRVGGWAATHSPIVPLLVGSAFVLITGIADAERPWLALAFVLIALGVGARSLLADRFDLSMLGAWPLASMFAVLLVVPGAPWQAAAAALLCVTAILLWPDALGRARVERGLLLAFVPPSAAFSALVAAAVATFDQATATSDILRAAPWTGVTALLPVLLAVGVLIGVRMARTPEPERFEPAPVIASWVVFGLALVAGLWPRFVSAHDPDAGTKVFVLQVAALVVAVVAGRWLPRMRSESVGPELSVVDEPLEIPARVVNVLTWSVAGFGAIASMAILWLAFRGLQVGFL